MYLMNITNNITHNFILDNFGPTNMTNMTNMNNFIETRDISFTLFYIFVFFPLYILGFGFLLVLYYKCISLPYKNTFKKFKYKLCLYLKSNNVPIKNNKLTKTYIEKLNKKNKITTVKHLEQITNTCSICMEPINSSQYNKNNKVIYLDCNHFYHTNCLNNWVETKITQGDKPTCPMCRQDIINQIDMEKINKSNHVDYIEINISYDSDSSTRTTLSDL